MDNKNSYQADIFSNRLKKNYKELRKWARKNRISCYRLYDRDIPEVPVSLDVYEFLPQGIDSPLEVARFLSEQNDRITRNDPTVETETSSRRYGVLYLYERPYEKDSREEEEWFNLMAITASYVLNVPQSHIVKKVRKSQKGLNQYEKTESVTPIEGFVQEQGQLFKINLSSYLDTGLFFDHRPLRAKVRESVSSKSLLNLFSYTGSFSVYAASGNAKRVESVDLSNTYLTWARLNMNVNGFDNKTKYVYTRGDVSSILDEKLKSDKSEDRYDVIVLDPPTFSNSKNTKEILDINKQWPELCQKCLNLLNKGGILYFSTNSTRLSFDETALKVTDKGESFTVQDITNISIPKDYEGTKCHRAWKIQLNK